MIHKCVNLLCRQGVKPSEAHIVHDRYPLDHKTLSGRGEDTNISQDQKGKLGRPNPLGSFMFPFHNEECHKYIR